MKHLKLFEGYLDNYYGEISYDEWQEIVDNNYEKISHKDIYKLKMLFNECDNIIDIDWDYNGVIKLEWDIVPKKNLYIESLVDDYYLVWIDYGISDWYFKCDQFEGLVKLLKDRGVL